MNWDVVIIGGGAGGLSAALMLGRARRRVLVIDSREPRNRFAAHMHGVLGNEGTDPAELLKRGREEVEQYDVEVRTGLVSRVTDLGNGLRLELADGESVTARAAIVASGVTDVLPDIPGLKALWGTDVLHCPYCHGWEVRDQHLGVIGTSPMSLHQAELIRQWSDRITLFTAGCGPVSAETAVRLRSRGVQLVDTPVAEVLSNAGQVSGVLLSDGDEVALDAIFTAPLPRPHDDFLADLALDRSENPMGSFIAVDSNGATSHPRVWAVGNVVNPAANVPVSIGAGALAAGFVNMALVTEDFDTAVDSSNALSESPEQHWEEQYAGSGRRWSGRVNATMAEVVARLPVGAQSTALELGCGEGGDAVWLATQGYQVTAVDISATAIARAAEIADAEGVGGQIAWQSADLASWTTDETFDLVTASFFHSTVELPRTEILRRAAGQVRPGGHLLIVSHVFEGPEDVPPWALRHHGAHDVDDAIVREHIDSLLSPADEVAELALDTDDWQVLTVDVRSRETVGPDGQESATVKDGVVLLRRRPRE